MATKIPPRLVWTVERLVLQPDDQVLEIGCGHGIAVSLICEKLSSGKITAIVGSSRVDLQACKLEYSIVSPK